MTRAIALLCALLSACSAFGREDDLESCSRIPGQVAFRFVGGAFGDGRLTLKVARDRAIVGQVLLLAKNQDQDLPALTMNAVGTCESGIVRLRFGSAVSPDGKIRTLGGRILMLFTSDPIEGFFGRWEAELEIEDSPPAVGPLTGFLFESQSANLPALPVAE